MNQRKKLIALLAIIASISILFISCEESDDDDDTLAIHSTMFSVLHNATGLSATASVLLNKAATLADETTVLTEVIKIYHSKDADTAATADDGTEISITSAEVSEESDQAISLVLDTDAAAGGEDTQYLITIAADTFEGQSGELTKSGDISYPPYVVSAKSTTGTSPSAIVEITFNESLASVDKDKITAAIKDASDNPVSNAISTADVDGTDDTKAIITHDSNVVEGHVATYTFAADAVTAKTGDVKNLPNIITYTIE